ncbi:MAG: ribosome biogenesis GTPase Der [Deltaproteobacteria bacterium]|nr:ribosome biogenesis GTPase Der [Deltaproteobacteria bacterium]
MKPVIAIIGRPNVGKSTLFNRLINKRRAIVNDTPGVTRDRLYAEADWCGKKFTLIDTGGLAEGDEKSIEAQMKKQAFVAINEADLVVCVFDGREGPVPLDSYIIGLLRKAGKTVVYVVNKVERKLNEASNLFYELGIKENIVALSAEHGLGIDDLLDEVVKTMDPRFHGDDKQIIEGEGGSANKPRVAIIGRPNAGKSTLINRLAGFERVIAHETPGTTRDTVDIEINFNGRQYIFVDTAGLRKKGKTIETLDKYSAIKTLDAIARADVALLMVDSNEGFTHQDSALLDHAYSEGKSVAVLFNKWDALKTDAEELAEFYSKKLLPLHRVPFLCISAKKGENIEAVFDEIDRIYAAGKNKLKTSEVNEILEDVVEMHNLPTYRGKSVRLYYATQVSVQPPAFVVFTNQPDGVHESYKKYLINKLQEVIGTGVPIRIKFKRK